MTILFLHIYDYLSRHRLVCFSLLFATIAAMVAISSKLTYNEDIYDFLPLDTDSQRVMDVYMEESNANRIIVVFETPYAEEESVELLKEAVDSFEEAFGNTEGPKYAGGVICQVGIDEIIAYTDSLYRDMPFYLSEADYKLMEEKLKQPDFVDERLDECLQALMMPTGNIAQEAISRDPLMLFSDAAEKVRLSGKQSIFVVEEGYIFTPDMRRAIALITTPFGSVESASNSKLLECIRLAISQVQTLHPGVEIGCTGAPVIAVGNADQIRKDSYLAITIAVVLILLLLFYAFRSISNILLIVAAIAFGWLFGMTGLALTTDNVSIIVLGMGAVIIGIAVNYPLHLIAHLRQGGTVREAIKEIAHPLFVGNVTTVAAFACLIPLDAIALRHLGIFASFMLVGTIIFVIVFMPHIIRPYHKSSESGAPAKEWMPFGHLTSISPERHRWLLWSIALLTPVLLGYSLSTSFDANLQSVNYMPKEQEELLQNLGIPFALADTTSFYVVDNPEANIAAWESFWASHGQGLIAQIDSCAPLHGFSDGAFDGFRTLITAPHDGSRSKAVPFSTSYTSTHTFTDLNQTMVNSLSDNFNYIGCVCGCVVFVFLCLSFWSIRLAILAFIPMAVGWVWILGFMSIFGIQFNIVSVILATFIFGQGDDYTIFMVEGIVNNQKQLPAYRNSVLISALIMFIGIGTLVIATHPALHSLGEVTIVGMLTVVIMAWLLPPLLYPFFFPKKARRDEKSC